MIRCLFLVFLVGCNAQESSTSAGDPERGDKASAEPVNIAVGATIAEVEAVNGKPFMIYGFEIDGYLAGTIKSWEKGALEGRHLQFTYTTFVEGIAGDHGISSDSPLLAKAGVVLK